MRTIGFFEGFHVAGSLHNNFNKLTEFFDGLEVDDQSISFNKNTWVGSKQENGVVLKTKQKC